MTNWSAWIPAFIALASALFVAGQTAGRIKGQEKTLARHEDWLSSHDTKLSAHDVEIAESRAWRDGYNAGKGR